MGVSLPLLDIRRPADSPKPSWLKVRAPGGPQYIRLKGLMREWNLHSVCEEAHCPNIGECWEDLTATFMILGDVCTRNCGYCAVTHGRPVWEDREEPERVGRAVGELGLEHVVITSVNRDDLADGGAAHFAACIAAIRAAAPDTTVEVLTPDFRHKPGALELVAAAAPDVYNHNVETVPRLYRRIRPGANFEHSVSLLARMKRLQPGTFTKSGLMLGLGEQPDEVRDVMRALRAADVDFLTIGQYLRPTPQHAEVARYVPPAEFEEHAAEARRQGFLLVSSTPLTRSSYHADEDFERLRAARAARPESPGVRDG